MRSADRPVFVVSAPRSGSTLLRLILDAHPRMAVPPPAWLYELIRPYLYSYGDLKDDANFRELCEDVLATPTISRWDLGLDADSLMKKASERSFAAVFEALHRKYAEPAGKPRWGEKTPRDSFWIDEIRSDFPDAQIVHIVRDGRDMAIDIADSTSMRPYSILMGAEYWKRYVGAIRESASRLPEGDFYELRYEDLCADPEATLRKLCAFLDEDFDPVMLAHHASAGSQSWAADPQHAKTGRPITTEFCEMYRHRLPAGDVAALEAVIGGLLEAYGYPTFGAHPLEPRLAGQILEGDLPSAPANHEYKAWHIERRRSRRERRVYRTEDRPSLLLSPE